MKELLVAAAVAVFGVTGAHSADVQARLVTKAPVVAPPTSWTGFYAGLNAGYGFDDPTVTFVGGDPLTQLFTAGSPITPASFNIHGGTFGGQLGYNWQVAPTWLVGLEADLNSFRASNAVTSVFNFGGFANSNIVGSQSIDWFGTVRGRMGWLPVNNLLVYGTGGLAYGRMNESVVFNASANGAGQFGGYAFTCGNNGAACFVGTQSRIATGYTAGAGLEYAIGRNVTLKAEYMYVNLGSTSVRSIAVFQNPGFLLPSFVGNFSDYHFNVVRFGANYRF